MSNDKLNLIFKELKQVNGRLGSMERHMSNMDGRMDNMEGRMDGMEEHMSNMDGRMDNMEGRMDGMEEHMGNIDRRMDGMEGRMDGMESHMGNIDRRMDSIENEQRSMKSEMNRRFDSITMHVAKNSEDIQSIKSSMATKEELALLKQAVLETNEVTKRIEKTQQRHEQTLDLLSRRSIDQEAELKRIK